VTKILSDEILSPVPLSLPFIVDIGDVDRIYFTVKHSWIVCGEGGVKGLE